MARVTCSFIQSLLNNGCRSLTPTFLSGDADPRTILRSKRSRRDDEHESAERPCRARSPTYTHWPLAAGEQDAPPPTPFGHIELFHPM